MNSALSDSPRPLQTYQHLYGYGGSNSGRGISSGSSSPARSSQADDTVPAPVHGFSPERHRERSNSNLEEVRKRIARLNANASSAVIPLRSDGVRRKSKRATYSEPLLSSRLVVKPYTTTQRPGRVIANASMRAAVGGDKGNTYVADVNPTFCIDGSIRYIEPINDRVAWTAEYDGSIRVRALPQGSEVRIIEGRENTFCTCLLYLQEYHCVWVAFNDGFMRVYDVEGFTMLKEFVQHAGGVNCMVELEGSVYTGGVDWKIGLWNPETVTFERLFYGHAGGVRCLYPFSGATGSILFSGSDDGSIKAWDPYAPVQTEEDRACLHTFKGHDRGVLCLEAIGPLSQLWSGGEDGTVRVWDLKTLECLNVLEAHTSPVSCLLLVESRLWSGDKYGHIILWDVLLQSPLQEITSRMQGAKLGMVLAMKKVQPATCWKIWTAGCTGFVQCWNADTIPIVFDRKYAYKYGQKGIHDLLLELETFAQLLEEELASTKEEASRQRERGRMEVQHILESKQLVEGENEDLRRRLREQKTGRDGDEHAYEKVDYLERSPGGIPDREEKEKYENQRHQIQELQHQIQELQHQIQELQQENDRLKHQMKTAAAAARSASAASSATFSFTEPSDVAATPAVVAPPPPASSPLAAALFPPASAYKGEITLTPHHVLLPGRYWEQILQDRPHQLRELAKEDICMAIGIPDAQLRSVTLGTVDVVRISQEEAEKEEGEDDDECMTGTPDTRRLRYRKESRLTTSEEARNGNTLYESPSLPTSPSGSRSDSFRFNEGSTTTKTVVLPRGTHSAAQEEMVLKEGAGLCLRVWVIHDILFPKEEVQRRLDSFFFPRLMRLHQRMQYGIEGTLASGEEGHNGRLPEKVGLDAAEQRIRELERRLAERSQASSSQKVRQEPSESAESEISFTEIETEEKEEVPPKVSRSNKSVRFDESEVGTDKHAPWDGEEDEEEGEDEEEDEDDEDDKDDDEENAKNPKGKEKGSASRMEFLRVELEHAKDNVEYYKDVISEKEKQRLALAQEVDSLRSLLAAAPSASPFSVASMGKNSADDGTDAASIEMKKNAHKAQTIQALSDLQEVLKASKKKAEMVREDMQAFFRHVTTAPRQTPATTTTVPRSGRRWSNPAAGGGLSSSLDLLHRPEDPRGWRGREEREGKQVGKEGTLSSSVLHGHRVIGASPPYHERGAVEKPPTAYEVLSSGVPPSLSAGRSNPPSMSSSQKPQVHALPVPPIPHRSPSLNTSLSWASQSQQQIAAHMQEHPYKEHHLPPPLQSFPPTTKSSWGAGGSRPTSSSFYPVGPPTRAPQGSRNGGSSGPRPLTPERIQRDTLERPTYPAWARAALKSTADEPPRKRNASSSSTSLSDEDDLETDVRKLYEQQFTKGNRPASASTSHVTRKNYGMSSSNAKVPERGAAATSRPTSLSHYAVPTAANPPLGSQQRQEREQKYPSKTSRDARSFSPSVSMASPPPGQHFKVLNHTTNPYIGLSAAEIQALPLPSEISAGYQAHRHSRHSAEDIASMNAALLARVADVESVMAILSEQHEQSQSRASLGIN